MNDFVLAPLARDDINEIWDYYAKEVQNVGFADRIVEELFTAFDRLVKTPGMGHCRSDLSVESLRFWKVRDYFIISRSEKCPLEIVRVLHGKRDIQAILNDTPEFP